MEQFTQIIFRYKWMTIFLVLLVVMLCASGGQRLRFSTDYRMFFSKQNPNLQAFEALQNTYTKHDNIMFVLTPKDKEVFTPSTLAAIQWLTEQAWLLPYSIRVDSLTNFQNIEAQADDLYVDNLIPDDFDFDPKNIANKKTIALQDPLLVKRIISEQSHVTGVNVTVQFPDEDLEKALPETVDAARHLQAQFEQKYPDITVRLSGIVMQNNAFTETSMRDLKTLTPIMLSMVIIGVGIFLRSFVAILGVVIVMLGAILSAMGIAGFLGITLSPATVTAPTVIMTLAVADSVHLLSTFYWRIDQGDDKFAAMLSSFKLNTMPIFLTSLTTMFGFLSLNFSDAPPFRDLGNIVAIGVWAAFLITMSLLPAVVFLFPTKPSAGKDKLKSLFPAIAKQVIKHQNKCIIFVGTLCVVCLAFLPKNELNDEWVGYFSPKTTFREAADYLLENLTGLSSIHYSIEAKEAEGINNPDYMFNLEKFVDWIHTQPEVIQVSEVTHIIKKLNKSMHGDDEAMYRIPDNRELIAQYLLLYELSLPRGLDMNNTVNVDKSATRLQIILTKMSTNEILAFEKRVQNWMDDNFPAYMRAKGTSPDIMFAHIGFTNIRSLLFGSVIALVLISLLLCIAFRSIKFGLFSALPNLLPIGVAFGVWGLFVGEVGLSLSVVAGMTLGIVVDDTIHFLSKYRHARLNAKTSEEAIHYAFDSVGKALFVTSAVLVLGFLVLTLSDFKLNSSMGALTAATIGIALIIDFYLIPPLLLKFEGKSHALLGTHSHNNH